MTVALSSLRVTADMDGRQYAAGAKQIETANSSMAESSLRAAQALARSDRQAGQSGGVLATLSRQFIAGYGAAQNFEKAVATLGRALDKGAIDMGRAETVLEGIYRKYGQMADGAELAARGHQQLAAAVTAVNARFTTQMPVGHQFAAVNDNIAESTRNLAFQQQNLRYQLIDTATSLAGGMPLYMVLMQQGGQIATIWGPNEGGIGRAFKETAAMAVSLVSRLWPLAAVGAAVGAAYIALSRSSAAAAHEVDGLTKMLAEQAGGYAQVNGKISDLMGVQKSYDQALSVTKKVHGEMSASIVADTEREFNAKKTLLELELQYQQALIATQRASIAQAGERLKAEIGNKVQTNMYGAYQGYRDDRVGDFVRLPDDITGLAKTQEAIDGSPISLELKRMRAELELNEVAANKLSEALKVTFNPNGTPKEVKEKKGHRERESDYERTIRRIREQTAAETEQSRVIDLSTFARERQAATQAILTAAQRDGLEVGKAFANAQELINVSTDKLSPALVAERQRILDVAGAYAQAKADAEKAEEAQRKFKELMEFAKETTRGFIQDFRGALGEGATVWEAFAQAALNALDKVVDKLLGDMLDAIFKVNEAGAGGGGGGILGSLFGGLFGGGGGRGFQTNTTLGSFLKNGFANGGVFDQGINGFSNQIVNRPTVFAFAKGAGLMGEAGPEAIMPLRRDASGRLGVSAAMSRMFAPGNDNGDGTVGRTVIQITLAPEVRAEILREARGQSVEIVKEANVAQQNYRQNGGE